MMNRTSLLSLLFATGSIICVTLQVSAQGKLFVIDCDKVYSVSDLGIFSYNTETMTIDADFVPFDYNFGGIAIGPDLKTGTPNQYLYTTFVDYLYYYDEGSWVPTGHNMMWPNIAGGSSYIFSLNYIDGIVYRYDGTGDAVELVKIDNCCSTIADIIVDTDDNFYIIHAEEHRMLMYDKDGNQLRQFEIHKWNDDWSTGGVTRVGNTIYAGQSWADFSETSFKFSEGGMLVDRDWDYGACALEPLVRIDSVPEPKTGPNEIDCSVIYAVKSQALYGSTENPVYGYRPLSGEYLQTDLPSGPEIGGLAICRDLNNKTDQLRFYTSMEDTLYYFDGGSWISTHHYGGPPNPAGGANYIFSIDARTGDVYRYDGTGHAELILHGQPSCRVADLIVDLNDHFMLIGEEGTNVALYDENGALIREYVTLDLWEGWGSGGFAGVGNQLYFYQAKATLSGDTAIFSPSTAFADIDLDFASCPMEPFELIKEPSAGQENVYAENNIPLRIEGRAVDLQHTIRVPQSEFDIAIWDPGVIDGDSISLYLNGQLLIADYEVSAGKKMVHITIPPEFENNYLVLYAQNLGEFPPNTASLAMVINGVEHQLVLSSDLSVSGALNFVLGP